MLRQTNIEDKISDITNLATNASLNPKINVIKDEIPSITTNLTSTTAINAKINEVKGETPNITNLATSAAFTAAEIKIPNVGNVSQKNRL